tara:strand:+ start:232 stop:558 length:327 start_codon:yes stop_codon:yes gene_type:complete
MKTFQQFMKETPKSDNLPSIIKSLKGIATEIGTQNPDLPKQIRNTVIKGVAKKFAPTIKKGASMAQKNMNTMQKELPGAMDKFDSFLKSGAIEKGFGKVTKQLNNMNK